jgi:ribosomal protein S18 acetylase RimI-like enzyme
LYVCPASGYQLSSIATTMPQLIDRTKIRCILETDRPWAVYALGDLAPALFEHGRWFAAESGAAIVLLYAAFDPPVLFALGEPVRVRPLLAEMTEVAKMYLHVRPDIVPLLRNRYRIENEQPMWRMVLDRARYQPASAEKVVSLGPADTDALLRLYADGDATGEAPDFFHPTMVEQGAFFGVREGGELIAAGGTHVVSRAESVAAIGNIYTRRDRRGAGWGTRVASAVATALLGMDLRTIALNVAQTNTQAIRIYERLGFVRYCEYVEGAARKR